VRSAYVGERQALGHDRVDLAATKQVEKREVMTFGVEPVPYRALYTHPVEQREFEIA
jgi:hypothetical protein